ncbi:Rab GDP dissociation inhibitor beta [Asimina triloba]
MRYGLGQTFYDKIHSDVLHLVHIKYGLNANTVDFIGHALALHRDDCYLDEPALDTVKRMKLYAESLARFQGGSPYIYPLYGLGELPQAFARLSAVYGGTYMLNKPECKVEFNEEGKVRGVTSEGETAKCKKVVCDPSYLPNKATLQVRKVGKVARAICIMSHPIPNTKNSHSVQVILPQKQLGRRSDMYLFCCSYSHNVAPRGKFIAFVSAEAETDRPDRELKPGIDLLGPVDESYDATTHFESTVMDVLSMYTLITGKRAGPLALMLVPSAMVPGIVTDSAANGFFRRMEVLRVPFAVSSPSVSKPRIVLDLSVDLTAAALPAKDLEHVSVTCETNLPHSLGIQRRDSADVAQSFQFSIHRCPYRELNTLKMLRRMLRK